ncbi:MAG: serine hydrolase [Thermoanaerobaculia bacterium]|nr:serine hydrolase [Thermoanaerobaculia bacterium]
MLPRPVFRRVAAAFVAGLLLPAATVLADAPDFVGHWEGAIAIPGQPLEFEVDLELTDDGSLSGDLSIPAQQLRDYALSELRVEGDDIHFEMAGIPGTPTFDGTRDGDTVAGTFVQGGGSLSFEMSRAASDSEDAAVALDGFGAQVEKALADLNIPGAGLAVVHGGEVVLAEGYGLRDAANDLPMTADSLFAIGSTTKAMTATLLGMLADEGRFDFDAPVVDYLPQFQLSDRELTLEVTARDILTHRTGLPRHDLAWYGREDAEREALLAAMSHFETSAGLRETWQYNNFMFMTAGYLAGQLEGSDWESVIRARLFAPLGMNRTNVHVTEAQQDDDHAVPHREADDGAIEVIPFRPIEAMGPAGAVNSSVREMARWLQLNLNEGHADTDSGAQLIQAGTLADIHNGHMAIGVPSTRADISPALYGLGWMVDSYRGHRRLSHGGGIDGFNTMVALFPDDGLGVVAFTNRNSGLSGALAQNVADLVLGLEPIDWIGEQVKARAQGEAAEEQMEATKDSVRVQGTSPSHDLADYAGTYEHPGYGRVTFAVSDASSKALTLDFHGIQAPVEHWHYDTWSGAELPEDSDGDRTLENMKFLFRTDFDGVISAVEAPLEPLVSAIVFERVPDPLLSDPAYLEKLAGTYAGLSGVRFRLELQGNRLSAHIPGQPIFELKPKVNGHYQLGDIEIVSVEFLFDEAGDVSGMKVHQPGGAVEAERVKE